MAAVRIKTPAPRGPTNLENAWWSLGFRPPMGWWGLYKALHARAMGSMLHVPLEMGAERRRLLLLL